jgi:NAD(P)-dependent dehydrogenase (short-subunit alcohol dehydrogenase family)
MNFQEKTAIIIGGGSGIGAETARVLHRSGANVVLSGRRAGALRDVAESLDSSGSSARIVAGDISAAGTAEAIVA